MFLVLSNLINSSSLFLTISSAISSDILLNLTIFVSLFLNSGVNVSLTALSILLKSMILLSEPNPFLAMPDAPALLVIIINTFLKSACLPLLSVSVALSITCNNVLNTFGLAFSISSSSNTQCGCFLISSTSSPPSSYPT